MTQLVSSFLGFKDTFRLRLERCTRFGEDEVLINALDPGSDQAIWATSEISEQEGKLCADSYVTAAKMGFFLCGVIIKYF